MSIALENNRSNNNGMGKFSGGFLSRNKVVMSPCNLTSVLDPVVRVVMEDEERENGLLLDHHHHHHPCSSSSSSIGINSDDDDDDDDEVDGEKKKEEEREEEEEVQSKLKTNPFDSAVDALEQALPISRRGISKFYNGKSKSFASLADATACSTIKDITKPENAYSRKRKNLLAYSLLYNKGIAKRSTNPSRSTFAFAVAMNNCEGPTEENPRSNNSRTPSVSPPLSPLPPPPWRSFSLADLQHCGVSVSSGLNSNLSSSSLMMGKRRTKTDEVS